MKDKKVKVFFLDVTTEDGVNMEAYSEMNPNAPITVFLIVARTLLETVKQLKSVYEKETGNNAELQLEELENELSVKNTIIKNGIPQEGTTTVQLPCHSNREH
jgi:hypothetical protein